MLVLDTHALVWLVAENSSLGPAAKLAIANAFADSVVAISAMSFWEVTMLANRGRITIHDDVSSWREKVLRLGVTEIPVTGEVAIAAVQLSDFHHDPADRLITATALVNGATLLTADRRILRWQSPLNRIDGRK